MKQFFDWYYDQNRSVRITIVGIRVIIHGFCDKEAIEMALEFGCNGVSVDDNAVSFQFP